VLLLIDTDIKTFTSITTVFFFVFLTYLPTLPRELRVFEKRELRRIFEPTRDEVMGV
jgi:hypothetical protein